MAHETNLSGSDVRRVEALEAAVLHLLGAGENDTVADCVNRLNVENDDTDGPDDVDPAVTLDAGEPLSNRQVKALEKKEKEGTLSWSEEQSLTRHRANNG